MLSVFFVVTALMASIVLFFASNPKSVFVLNIVCTLGLGLACWYSVEKTWTLWVIISFLFIDLMFYSLLMYRGIKKEKVNESKMNIFFSAFSFSILSLVALFAYHVFFQPRRGVPPSLDIINMNFEMGIESLLNESWPIFMAVSLVAILVFMSGVTAVRFKK